MAAQHGEEHVLAVYNTYLKTGDAWYRRNGYDVPTFSRAFDAIRLRHGGRRQLPTQYASFLAGEGEGDG